MIIPVILIMNVRAVCPMPLVRLNEKDRGLTNIKENDRIELNVQMQRYMEYHREIFKYMEEQYS